MHEIKFTHEYSYSEVAFLDTRLYFNEENRLLATLYVKPTDSHNYLMYNLAHPQHIKDSIPYSQFIRIKRICSEWSEFLLNSLILVHHFQVRGYPQDIILHALSEANKLKRDELLTNQPLDNKKEKNNFFFVMNYNPANPNILGLIKKHWPYLGRSCGTRFLLDYNISGSFRRAPTLSNALVRAEVKAHGNTHAPSLGECKRKNTCRYCPKLDKKGHITSQHPKRTYYTMKHITCQSFNLIYCLSCDICGIRYVGQTKNRIVDRIGGHFGDIKNAYEGKKTLTDKTVARHFESHTDRNFPLTITVLEFIRAPPDSILASKLRDQKEKMWISRLNTLIPNGLNIMERSGSYPA